MAAIPVMRMTAISSQCWAGKRYGYDDNRSYDAAERCDSDDEGEQEEYVNDYGEIWTEDNGNIVDDED